MEALVARFGRRVTCSLVVLAAVSCASPAHAASPEEIEQKLRTLEEQIGHLKRDLEDAKKAALTPPAAPPPVQPPAPAQLPSPVAAASPQAPGAGLELPASIRPS